jgi:transcriptional regulator with PAS, ATPase and Fis domain
MKLLRDYSWPGNVRQFLKIVERAALLDMPLAAVMEEEKSLGELAEEVSDKETKDVFRPSLRTDVKPIKEIQEIYARHIWELFDGNYRATARAMAVNVNTLRYNYLNEAKAES